MTTQRARAALWDQPLYFDLLEEVDPCRDTHLFRSRFNRYTGQDSFWKLPSPEPVLPAAVRVRLSNEPVRQEVRDAAAALAGRISAWRSPDRIVLVAILRAGVPIAAWLAKMLPASVAVTTSLFVGVGIDRVALRKIETDYPNREIVFVDGWTGKGGVADELKRTSKGPLAVLSDPWQKADFRGTHHDVFSPSALFTGPTTMGFSRTFVRDKGSMFASYRFPELLLQPAFVKNWMANCPASPVEPHEEALGKVNEYKTELRVHSNEVCRALINSHPGTIYFEAGRRDAEESFTPLIELSAHLKIPCKYDVQWLRAQGAKVACSLEAPASGRSVSV